MSSGPRTAVGTRIYGAGAAPKVGCPNGSDCAEPPGHAGMHSGVCSDYHFSLLNSLSTRRGMPLMDQLEQHRGLFLDSASTLFFGGERSGSGELQEDSSSPVAASMSSRRIGSLPLFCLNKGAGCETLENPDFLRNDKMVISVKI